MTPPAYRRIADTIAERLASGTYEAGARLPSESQFCAEFGVSHMTLRRALNVLADRGLVSAAKGRGTFVRALDVGDSVFSLRELLAEHTYGDVKVRLLSASSVAANNRVASVLDVPLEDPVVYLRHVVLSDDTPAIYHREYVRWDPHRSLIDLLLQSRSLHGLLDTIEGQGFPRSEITLRATVLGRAAARILEGSPGAPALHVEHLLQDATNRPVSWGYFLLRADLFRLRSHLGA